MFDWTAFWFNDRTFFLISWQISHDVPNILSVFKVPLDQKHIFAMLSTSYVSLTINSWFFYNSIAISPWKSIDLIVACKNYGISAFVIYAHAVAKSMSNLHTYLGFLSVYKSDVISHMAIIVTDVIREICNTEVSLWPTNLWKKNPRNCYDKNHRLVTRSRNSLSHIFRKKYA